MKPLSAQTSTPYDSQRWLAKAWSALAAGGVTLGFLAATSTQGQLIYCEDFNAPGATADSTQWNTGQVLAGGDSITPAVTASGLAGSGALVTSVHVTDGASLSAYSRFYAPTLSFPAGADPLNVSLTADVTGNRTGAPFALIIDDNLGDQITFHGRVGQAGKFQTVGGRLGSGSLNYGSFDYIGYYGYSIILAFEPDAAWANGTDTLTLDNVTLQIVPPAGTNYVQDFNAPGLTPNVVGWSGGFAYSGGDSETQEIVADGPDGSGALVTSVNVTDPANLGAFTEYWSGTMTLPAGSDAYSLALTANVKGSRAGVPFALKLNDHSSTKSIVFNGVTAEAGKYQPIGGRLNLASSVSSSFSYASSNGYSIILAFNPGSAWAVGTNTLTIDNVVLATLARSGTNYAQNFDAPGATPTSVGWNGGFAYSGGTGATKTIAPTGVGGSSALVTTLNVTDPATLGAWTEYWSGTLHLPNNSSPNSLVLTAQVTGSQAGVPFSLRFNDHASPTSHYITFTGTIASAGVFQSVGGRLADATTVDPNFDFASTNGYSLMLTFNPSPNWPVGSASLTIDNVVLQTVTSGPSFSLSIAGQANQAILSWPTLPGTAYAVQFADFPSGGSWFNLASPFVATGTTSFFTNAVAGTSSRFFRIQAQ